MSKPLKEARVDTRWFSLFFLFHGIFFHQILTSMSLKEQTERKGQVRKNLLCNDYDHIISKLHRDVSAHYPPRTGIQSRRRHLVETLLLILRD